MKKIKESALDKAFSLYIRNRDQKCMRCGRSNVPLFCMHYHSRVARSVRWDEHNAIAGCYGCHRFLESRKTVEHKDIMYKLFGKRIMNKVEKAYRIPKKFTEAEKQALLNKFRLTEVK